MRIGKTSTAFLRKRIRMRFALGNYGLATAFISSLFEHRQALHILQRGNDLRPRGKGWFGL